jgi:hypothetical protein
LNREDESDTFVSAVEKGKKKLSFTPENLFAFFDFAVDLLQGQRIPL